TVCALLADAGFEAWFVGGCVRNTLLDAPVADLDLSTNARPDVVMKLAQAAELTVFPTGIDHGTVTIIVDKEPIEVTTFRKDVATDGRRAVVAFADTMLDDARRRDFTMNALYADRDGVVADPLGGLPDLKARHVRFIEDPDRRIREDYLRILRFFRFHAWYGNVDDGIDADGLAACAENVEGIQSLSKERIGQEMIKLLAAPDPAPAVASFASCGGLMQVLPGADHGALAVLVHIEQNAEMTPDPIRRLAVLGGMDVAENLRLSKVNARRLDVLRSDMSPTEIAYRHDCQTGMDKLAIECASLGQNIDTNQSKSVNFAASQTFPITAQDLMPALQGAALGEALKAAEKRWIASGFTLTKDDLID
ncbi:CCA tRNA nucleotidyltransferase, partial [Yoonia sp.]